MSGAPASPSAILGLTFRGKISEDDVLELVAQGSVVQLEAPPMPPLAEGKREKEADTADAA
eukprot:scaffold5360_cov95-Pinguiococcus_pyrenoidosus.AAC.1